MPMTEAQRRNAVKHLARKLFDEAGLPGIVNVDDLKAAIAALDDEFERVISTITNQTRTIEAHLNSILPEPVKSIATQPQKALILAYTAMKTYGVI